MHQRTGLAPSVALHIPWDEVDDYREARRSTPPALGVRLGTINSNTFQDDDYKLGSLAHPDPSVRQQAIDHHSSASTSCTRPVRATSRSGSPTARTIPARTTSAARQDRLAESLAEIYERLGDDQRLVLEYKFFEPAFYHTDVPDWGTSYVHGQRRSATGPWCASTPATTRPAPTSSSSSPSCCGCGKLGSFDFNSRFYADDDLIVGAADPFQLFRILVRGASAAAASSADSGVVFMLDQCHNIEQKIPGQIRSVLNVQEMTARALLVDADALAAAQEAGDVLAANEVFMDAFYTDVRPDLADWRESRGLPARPDGGLRRVRVPERDRDDARRRHPGRLGRLSPHRGRHRRPDAIGRRDMTNPTVEELIARSNRLGADRKNTNYAGGNTSAKGTDIDPVTSDEVELMWVKGSGGDLGTLTEAGLAVLRLDRLRALVDVYPGVDREDEMVAAFDFCARQGGAAPSIDTAMHGLVDRPHVDHLHPDSGIAIATAIDGEQLTTKIFGDKVVWVPWRRPGFELGLDIAKIQA